MIKKIKRIKTACLKLRWVLLLATCPFVYLNAQDLSNMGFKKGLKVNGGVNLSNIFYGTNDTVKRRDPYQFILTGNMNLNVFGYDAPFTFTYSNTQRSYTQPFNRITFNPQYKWIKTYIGNTNMSFSPYTLAGHSFLGAGAELSPGNWRIALMAGQLKKAIDYNPLNTTIVPTYKRMGYGVKLGYEKAASSISANVFTASDKENSIHQLPANGELHPMKNLAMGVSARTTLLKYFMLQGDYSISILNGDTRMKTLENDSSFNLTSDQPLSGKAPATRTYDAWSAGIGYQTSPFGLIFRYERVAPDYQTLGAYYFNNDMENITIAPNARFFNGKLSIAGNAGLQRNNLDKSRESTTQRWVGSGNINFNPSAKWNLGANYSNFSTYTRMRPQNDPFFRNELDSLNFYQLTNQMGGTVNYTFGKKEAPHSLMLNTSYQVANETNPGPENGTKSGFVTANAAWSKLFPEPGLSVSVSYNINASKAPATESLYQGPALSMSKLFLEKKLRTGFSSAWNQNSLNGKKGSPVWCNGFNMGYTPPGGDKVKHSITFNLTWLQRYSSPQKKQYQSEITGNLNYAFNF